MDVAVYGPLKTYFEREVNFFQKSHPGRIINQYDVARLLSPAFLKSAVAQNAVHGFEKPGIWPVNKYAFGDEDYEPAAAIAGTPFAETSSTPSPSILQEQIPSNSVDPLSEIFPSRNRTPSCEFQDFVAPIVNTPEKIRSDGCTPEPEPGCSRIVSAFGPDIAAQRSDTVVPETEANFRQNTSRDNSPDPKPGCSASHCSPLVLRPIPNPAKPF
ncbi:unnamed protein product, partial [Brenthis ino]